MVSYAGEIIAIRPAKTCLNNSKSKKAAPLRSRFLNAYYLLLQSNLILIKVNHKTLLSTFDFCQLYACSVEHSL